MSCYEVVTSTPARPSTCPSQEQGSHETGEAPAPGTRHVPESRDRLRLGQDMGPWVALARWGHGWAGQGCGAGDWPHCTAGQQWDRGASPREGGQQQPGLEVPSGD